LKEGRVFERLKKSGVSIREVEMLYPAIQAKDEHVPLSHSFPIIREFNVKLSHAVQNARTRGSFPVVVGGDHSIAVGTWSAFDPPFGLLWFDAHMDAHTDRTTPSGAYHGMPLAALLGHGAAGWALTPAVLKPENLALIGVRSFEEGEAALLKKLDVRIYYMDEVKERGLEMVVKEALAHITRGCSHFGVSLDLDVCSTTEAPGVGSPEEGGVRASQILPAMRYLGQDERLIGFEMVELNPSRDRDHKTRELAFEVLKEVMGSG
jgi:arginase